MVQKITWDNFLTHVSPKVVYLGAYQETVLLANLSDTYIREVDQIDPNHQNFSPDIIPSSLSKRQRDKEILAKDIWESFCEDPHGLDKVYLAQWVSEEIIQKRIIPSSLFIDCFKSMQANIRIGTSNFAGIVLNQAVHENVKLLYHSPVRTRETKFPHYQYVIIKGSRIDTLSLEVFSKTPVKVILDTSKVSKIEFISSRQVSPKNYSVSNIDRGPYMGTIDFKKET